MKKTKIPIIFLLFIVFSSYAQNNLFNVLNIPENLKKDANSVVIKDEVLVTMTSQNSYTLKSQQIITVLNKLGDENAQIILSYDKRRTIKNVSVYIYDALGNEVKKIKRKDFTDVSASDGFSLYNDGRYLYYKYIPISYPYTIQYIYEFKSSNTAHIPEWHSVGSYNQSVQLSKYTFEYPKDLKLKKSEHNFEKFKVKTTEVEGKISYEVTNILAVKYEPYAPSLSEIVPNAKVGIDKFNLEGVNGTAENWREFGKWYYDNLIKNRLTLSESTKQKMIKLTSGVTDTIEKAKLIYNYVQNKVRYISVQVGIGGFKPMLASDVDRLGYGDCKALTNYTAALLNSVGIKAYHTLIYADKKKDIDKNVVSPQGNHMILYLPIENKDIWLECTSQKSPFAEIANFTDDRNALVITPQGGEIKHTKIYKTTDNLQQTTGEFLINDKGELHAKINIKSYGSQYDDHLGRYDGESPKELEVLLKRYFSNINNIYFSKAQVLNKKEEGIYEENLTFDAEDYASFAEKQMLVTVNALNRNSLVPKRIRNRKLPFEIIRGYKDVDSIKIQIPTTLKVTYIPVNIEIKNKFGSYTMNIEKTDESHYTYIRKVEINSGNYPKEMYDEYRKFRKQIRKYDNSKIILTK